MSMQNYGTVASRNLIRAAQGMLRHAEPVTVLGDFGQFKEMPKNSTDTIVFRRTLPFGASAVGTTIEGAARYVGTPSINVSDFVLAEGATPNSNTISFQDVTVTLQEYGVLFKFSNKTEDLYEDDIPAEMVKQTGETMAEVLELVRYGTLKAGSAVIYANGSSRSAVSTPISLNAIRKATRTIKANRGRFVTSRIEAGPNFATRPVEPTYLVFVHTDAESDIRNLPGFTKVVEYGHMKPVHEMEIGACENYRFITSPVLNPYLASGAAVGSTGMLSVGAANVDVYPFVVIAEDAWGQVALKGSRAITPTVLRAGQRNHANPLGRFGYVGASTWHACVRLNDAWMVRIEAGVSAL